MNIGQPSLDSIVIILESLVIDTEQMQDRRVKVGPGDGILDRLPADVIRGAVTETVLQASPAIQTLNPYRL